MSVNGKNGNPIVTPADRAALESLARREDRAGIRARIVLKVADGSSHAGAARAVFATEKTVRAALRRFAEGGVECVARLRRRAGKAAAFPELKVSPPPELSRLRDGGARGPCPRARRKIET